MKSRWSRGLIVAVLAAVLLFALGPWLVGAWWRYRSANPVRRGVQLARELGCFSCHGNLGAKGIPDPGHPEAGVPGWSGGLWMMYVANDKEIRNTILNGSPLTSGDADRPAGAMKMPAYRDVVSATELADLVAAFKVLAGMRKPPADSPARRGYELARRWDCFSCHGPAGSGGLPNPGSFSGFIPGWYGADFAEMVRNRAEFDAWIRSGTSERLARNFIASRALQRQRLSMPVYERMTPTELDDLWAYTRWLAETGGGYQGDAAPW